MKNFDFKKLLVFLVLIAIVGLVIFAIVKLTTKGKSANEEEMKIIESVGIDYMARLTQGYVSDYNGVDLLYSNEEKVTYDSLTTASILNVASRYVANKELDNTLSSDAVDRARAELGPEGDNYTAYKGEAIRQAIKELFGVDFVNQSAVDEIGFGYNFYYNSTYDIYLKGTNSHFAGFNYDNDIRFEISKTQSIKKGQTLKVEIAVAYTRVNEDQKRDYAKDPNGETIVVTLEQNADFPKDKLTEFEKYVITLKKDGDNYVFESFEKGTI